MVARCEGCGRDTVRGGDGRCLFCWYGAPVETALVVPPPHGEPVESDAVAAVLLGYQRSHRILRKELAARLGISAPKLSKILSGAQRVDDVAERRSFAERLGVAPEALGVTTRAGTTWHGALATQQTVRAAATLRLVGQPAAGTRTLGAVLPGLLRAARRQSADPATRALLAEAAVEYGILLGDVLPQQHLDRAVDWDWRAARAARESGDLELEAYATVWAAQELRKADRHVAAERLFAAAEGTTVPWARGCGAQLRSRLYGALGDGREHQSWLTQARIALDVMPHHTPMFSELTVNEVALRGRVEMGTVTLADVDEHDRRVAAIDLGREAPQWRTMYAITRIDALVRVGEREEALARLRHAAEAAAEFGLPRQLERIVRLARGVEAPAAMDVADEAHDYLRRLEARLSSAA